MTDHRCHVHPSRNAALHCRVCGRWLCDSCVRVWGVHIYCGGWCRARDLVRSGLHAAGVALFTPVPAPWALAVVACATALLLSSVGIRVAQLVEESTPVAVAPAPAPTRAVIHVTGTVVRSHRRWRLELSGPSGAGVLVVVDDRVDGVAILDDGGGAVRDLGGGGTPPEVTVFPLAAGGSVAMTTPTPTPRATPTPTPAVASPTPRPSVTRFATPPDVHLVADGGDRIALTFDGSAAAPTNGEVLDLLHRLGVHATLFVTGEFIRAEPALVRRAVLEGHEVGNHTFSHPHLTTYAEDRRQTLRPEVTREWFLKQLRDTEAAFTRATGRPMAPFWRAPFGEENATLRAWAAELGYLHVRWSSLHGASLDSRDWVDDEHSSLYQDAPTMMRRLLRFPELAGGIVLMHLGSTRETPAWDVLPELVSRLRARGIEPVPVSTLLEASPTWRPRLAAAEARHREVFSSAAAGP